MFEATRRGVSTGQDEASFSKHAAAFSAFPQDHTFLHGWFEKFLLVFWAR
jgi:hypothetical protein